MDAALFVAADDPTHLDAKVKKLAKIAAKHGVTEVSRQDGATLAGASAGHEHFGFKARPTPSRASTRVSAGP